MHSAVSSLVALKKFENFTHEHCIYKIYAPSTSLVSFSPSQFYNLSFLQKIYNFLCLFSIDSMNMLPGLSTSKCLIYAESLFWRTLILSQQPLTTSSILFYFLFTFYTRLDLVEIPQSLSACQLVVSL